VKKDTGLSVFGLLYYNTIITLPFLVAMVVTSSEFEAVQSYPCVALCCCCALCLCVTVSPVSTCVHAVPCPPTPPHLAASRNTRPTTSSRPRPCFLYCRHVGLGRYMFDLGFQFLFLSSALMAFFLNVTTFYATALNSPLAVNVTGQLKNFFAFLLGLVLFRCVRQRACSRAQRMCARVCVRRWRLRHDLPSPPPGRVRPRGADATLRDCSCTVPQRTVPPLCRAVPRRVRAGVCCVGAECALRTSLPSPAQ
jgi:hypothetical protein